jgi:alkylhydroperoxidase family enzyme
MSWLKSLPSNSRLFEVFQAFPETARPLIEYHEALMRGLSPFTVGRELIAAYVSGLNSCGFATVFMRRPQQHSGLIFNYSTPY